MPKSRLSTFLVPGWPKLAWFADVKLPRLEVEFFHGPMVETESDWACEAVWDGMFENGCFDESDMVFGSGIRLRDGQVVFVSSSTMMDRLWYVQNTKSIKVSNSLPCLLANAGLALKDEYRSYPTDMMTQCLGLNRYKRTIPTDVGDVRVLYLRNLSVTSEGLTEIDKPDHSSTLACFADYFLFLEGCAKSLHRNLNGEGRTHKILPVGTVSKGYDSCAAAVVARMAGCSEVFTITNASSFLPRSDSGRVVAERLGLGCKEYLHRPEYYRNEEAVWAVAGQPGGLNLTIFDYPDPLSLFFTGYRGDTIWSSCGLGMRDRSEPYSAPDIAGLGTCEFRLLRGVFHCAVPFLGSRKIHQVKAISNSREMKAWSVGGDYDRPIPRRILEEAGVPRTAFGNRKNVTTAPRAYFWPFTPECVDSFNEYLKARGLRVPSGTEVWMRRRAAHADSLAVVNFSHLLGRRLWSLRPHLALRGQQLLFQWANDKLRRGYCDGLKQAGYAA